MAHDIDDVWQLCKDIQTTLNDLHPIKVKVDALSQQIEDLEMVNYLECTMCHGIGTVIPSHNHSEPAPAPITCPNCSGVGRMKVGSAVEKD